MGCWTGTPPKEQHGDLWIWARVDPTAEFKPWTFYIRGTGHPMDGADDARFVSSVLSRGGALVWHVFANDR